MRLQNRQTTRMLLAMLALATVLVGLNFASATPASAADASDFDPGFLISDGAFFNGTSMTATQVDNFIDDRNPGCLQAVCLDNYKETIGAKAATTRCAAIKAASSQTAGQIIATVGKACGISPKAILVILQKEQSLVTSRTPSARAFQASMGAGCPDTAPCDGKYAGFYANVYYGASLLKGYTLPASSTYTRYAAGKTSKILYNPNSSCGTRSVFVRNQATHALYVYTPYTPNRAALKALYGTGDSCSAYGNRNFWRLFVDWFGVTGVYGETEIVEYWNTNGGGTGKIGEPQAAPILSSSSGGGYYRQYANGIIAWTDEYGARFIAKPFDALWLKTGIATAGWPTQSTVTETAAGGGLTQRFSRTELVQPEGVTAFAMGNGYAKAWASYGGPGGVLGWPHGAKSTLRTGLWTMQFDNGTVFHDGAKFGAVDASLLDAYLALGDVAGSLGWPTGNYYADTARNGVGSQRFENGKLYESATYGIHAVTGALYNGYAKVGGRAAIGWPTSDGYQDADSGLWIQDFEAASIITDGTLSVAVAKALLSEAILRGVIGGALGAPKSLPVESDAHGGGVYQDFASGSLAKTTTGNTTFVYGGLLTAWNAKGRAAGKLGWPIGDRYIDPVLGTVDQDFQYGTVFHNHVKWGSAGTHFVAVAREMGITTPRFGWATANVVRVASNGGGQYQTFTTGALTWQAAAGNYYVPTAVWNTVKANGGVSGAKIGWPKAAPQWTASSKTWKQSFQFATITCVTGKACTVKAVS